MILVLKGKKSSDKTTPDGMLPYAVLRALLSRQQRRSLLQQMGTNPETTADTVQRKRTWNTELYIEDLHPIPPVRALGTPRKRRLKSNGMEESEGRRARPSESTGQSSHELSQSEAAGTGAAQGGTRSSVYITTSNLMFPMGSLSVRTRDSWDRFLFFVHPTSM